MQPKRCEEFKITARRAYLRLATAVQGWLGVHLPGCGASRSSTAADSCHDSHGWQQPRLRSLRVGDNQQWTSLRAMLAHRGADSDRQANRFRCRAG